MRRYNNMIDTSRNFFLKKEKNKTSKRNQPQQTLDDLVEDLESLRPEDDEVGVAAGRQSELKLGGESKLDGAAASENLEAMEGKESWRFRGP